MSATIAIAKDISTGRIIHINDVNKTIGVFFECCGCKQKLLAVKTEARRKDWHFRHNQTTDIAKCRSTALHDFAVQIILENTHIEISNKLQIDYSEPRKEAIVFDLRSDVAVKYQNEDVHFEIFVTHDLDNTKIETYKVNKIKCVKIDLSERYLLTAPPEKINDVVLKQHINKSVVYWKEEIPKPQETTKKNYIIKWLLLVGGVFFGLRFLYIRFFKRKRRNLR